MQLCRYQTTLRGQTLNSKLIDSAPGVAGLLEQPLQALWHDELLGEADLIIIV